MIYLVEHFYSIQGEGKYVGTPSIFFRLGGCNMQCIGFGCLEKNPEGKILQGCDTLYAVDSSFKQLWTPITNANELITIMQYYNIDFNVDVVFTGGEPLLYAMDPIFLEFLEYLLQNNHRVTFETNATIAIDFNTYPLFSQCTFALSVKLQNSLEPYHKRIRPKAISSIAQHAKESFFKFSIDKETINAALDEEIEHICSFAPSLPIYCMPVGGTKEDIQKNALALIEYCKNKGYIYSDRLHIRIWDANKGV